MSRTPPSGATTIHNEPTCTIESGPYIRGTIGTPDSWDAAKQSGPCLRKTEGMCSTSDSLAGPSGASTSGRRLLQMWVPRKRNLASFDALDELTNLTGQKQHPAGGQDTQLPDVSHSGFDQELSATVPLRAPECLAGAQAPTLQGACLLSPLTVASAGLPTGTDGTSEADVYHAQEFDRRPCRLGIDLAATRQLPWCSGKLAPRRRLHHTQFASPRPKQRPEAEGDTSYRPLASSLVSAACGKDTTEMLEGISAALPHKSHLQPGRIRDSIPVPREPGVAVNNDVVISDSEADEASKMAPDRPLPVSGRAVVSVDRPCSTSPLRVPLDRTHSSYMPQQIMQSDGRDALGEGRASSHCAQVLLIANIASNCNAGEATVANAAAADVAARRSSTAKSAGRKRLKRLYEKEDLHNPPLTARPTQIMEGEEADQRADAGVLLMQSPSFTDREDRASSGYDVAPVSCAGHEPVLRPAKGMGDESPSEGAESLETSMAPEQIPAPRWHKSGRGLKRLSRITHVSPEEAIEGSCHPPTRSATDSEVAHSQPAILGVPRANPFVSAKAALPQEPRLACHAAPAQLQSNNLASDLLLSRDMHALLSGHGVQQQALAGGSMDTAAEAAAGSIIDLASDGSAGAERDCAGSPARPQRRRICLPDMPASPGRRLPPERQPSNRSYLGAYSSADILPEHTQLGSAHILVQKAAAAQGKSSPGRDWQGNRQQDWACGRCEGNCSAISQASFGVRSSANWQRDCPLHDDQHDEQTTGPGRQHYRKEDGLGMDAPANGAHPSAEPPGTSRQPRHGRPWWHRLDDFVPVAAIRGSRDPRDGSRVLIEYGAQFSVDKHPRAPGRGFQEAKRCRKVQHGAAAARVAETTGKEGSHNGHWRTTWAL